MPNIVYSVAERLVFVRKHEQGLSYQRIADDFAAANPGRPIPATSTIRRLVTKFHATGNIDPNSERRSYPTRQLSAETKANVLRLAQAEEKTPSSKIARELGISKSSVLKLIHSKERVDSCKPSDRRHPLYNEAENRLIFCNTMRNRLTEDDGLRYPLFTGVATIELCDDCKKRNLQFSDETDQPLINEPQSQSAQKLNVWVGIYRDRMIGPFFIAGHLTGKKYLQLLQEQVLPALRALDGNDPPTWFQHGEAVAHYRSAVRNYLHQEFPERWIGRLGAIAWPARSPNLTPLLYGLWPYLKKKLYLGDRIDDLPALRARVLDILGNVGPLLISDMTTSFWNRIDECIERQGRHFHI